MDDFLTIAWRRWEMNNEWKLVDAIRMKDAVTAGLMGSLWGVQAPPILSGARSRQQQLELVKRGVGACQSQHVWPDGFSRAIDLERRNQYPSIRSWSSMGTNLRSWEAVGDADSKRPKIITLT